jgi:N-glycosylase/DNA lyase
MVDSVCRTFGRDLGGRFSFPGAEDILARRDLVKGCKLGYREGRFIELAEKVADRSIVPDEMAGMSYKECFGSLKGINGVGDKVADCVSLFAFGHLNAFPIDARIERVLRERYNVSGNYRKLSAFAEERFGRYAGYAQELLYHCGTILGSQAHVGGSQPI